MTVYTSRYGFQWNYQPHDSGWGNGYNFAMRYSAATINCYLLSDTTPSPPSSPVEDDAYYVPVIASGDWTANTGKMAVWQGGAWQYYTIIRGTRAYIEDRPGFFWYNGTLWLPEVTSTSGVVLTVAGHPPDLAGNVALVVGDIAGAAALSSPTFTGAPLAPNASALSRSLQIANTKYVDDAVLAAGVAPGVISVAGRQGVVTLTHNDLTDWATATAGFGLPSIATLRVLANISGGTAVPSATTVTALLDAVFGTARGTVIYRGSSAWSALAPGTSGYVLTSAGASADPSWLGKPYDIAVYAEGALTVSEVFLRWIAPRAISIAAGASGAATASAAATGTAVINLAKNGSNFGTATYTSSATGVISITSTTAIAAGDTVTFTGPASVNATLLDVAITLAATQS